MDFRNECCLVLEGSINSASAESIGMRVFREQRGGLHSLPLGRQCSLFLSRGQDDKGGAGKTYVFFFRYQLICSGVYVCVYVQKIGMHVCRTVLAGACMAARGIISQVSPLLGFMFSLHVCMYPGAHMEVR